MPGPAKADDEACLLRVPYHQLESADFWRSLELDGLILYVIIKYEAISVVTFIIHCQSFIGSFQ
jgi:hypothetical protein